jgi:hypothetical protein
VRPPREPNDLELRSRLQQITDSLQGDRAGEQIEAIRQLRSSCPHSIVLVQQAIPGEPGSGSYTCHQYSFGLAEPPPAVRAVMVHYRDVFADRRYVSYMIEHGLTEVTPGEASDGDIVVYANDDAITHSGKVRANDLIVSKWGTAHLWQHRVFEIPLSYGGNAKFFRPVSPAVAAAGFLRYAESRMGRESIQALVGR